MKNETHSNRKNLYNVAWLIAYSLIALLSHDFSMRDDLAAHGTWNHLQTLLQCSHHRLFKMAITAGSHYEPAVMRHITAGSNGHQFWNRQWWGITPDSFWTSGDIPFANAISSLVVKANASKSIFIYCSLLLDPPRDVSRQLISNCLIQQLLLVCYFGSWAVFPWQISQRGYWHPNRSGHQILL